MRNRIPKFVSIHYSEYGHTHPLSDIYGQPNEDFHLLFSNELNMKFDTYLSSIFVSKHFLSSTQSIFTQKPISRNMYFANTKFCESDEYIVTFETPRTSLGVIQTL